MVGVTGIEPVTPTMSTLRPPPELPAFDASGHYFQPQFLNCAHVLHVCSGSSGSLNLVVTM